VADTPISSELRNAVAALLKETLRNIVQHSGATTVQLEFQCTRELIVLRIRDDGRGFEQSPCSALDIEEKRRRNTSPGGQGLQNFQARVQALGGSYKLTSAPDRGTLVEFLVPFQPGAVANYSEP
jgi:signal transduction histidine kinase